MRSLTAGGYGRLSEAGLLVPVFRELVGDLTTPVAAFRAVAERSERAFLLESVLGGERIARYSFLGRDPVAVLDFDSNAAGAGGGQFLAALRSALRRGAVAVPGLPRFAGGAVGYLGWDAGRWFEGLTDPFAPDDRPVASFALYRDLVAFDHVLQRIVLIANVEPGRRDEYERGQDVLDRLEADIAAATGGATRLDAEGSTDVPLDDGSVFRDAVRRAQQYITAGDAFQVVLSRQFRRAGVVDALAVYRALRMINPAPYMYFLKDGGRSIAGASPEMLVRVEGDAVETHPIAGTRRRGVDDADDAARGRELLSDEKERAEHVMLVDLGRNDLGRVCRVGSVEVPRFMAVERFSHVLHLVSHVTGRLAPGRDALDALVATFPAGTLSGAPKRRAMELIDELEPVRRGLYGGAIGYLDYRGNADFCIAIRTLALDGGQATIQAGAGIVADSDPRREQEETEAKAAAMFEALALAGRLA